VVGDRGQRACNGKTVRMDLVRWMDKARDFSLLILSTKGSKVILLPCYVLKSVKNKFSVRR
jgi:hypothetical protein